MAMAMNWLFKNRQGVGVLELRGYLGDSALARFSGAIGWALARCTGPVVIDLTQLQGWSASGQAALEEAAQRTEIHHRVLAICGSHDITAQQRWQDRQVAIPAYADLDTAVTALSLLSPAPNPGQGSEAEMNTR
jgi:anti-anti-sigma regulatory factor